jgi:hypothetical protein
MLELSRRIHFTEDGGEFNQIGSNLAMIRALIGPRRGAGEAPSWGNLQQPERR